MSTLLHTPYCRYVEYGPKDDSEHWWRAEDRRYADWDPWAEFEQPSTSHLQVNLWAYPVIRHTPKGVWLDCGFGGKRFVLGNATRQYAVPTKELALADLVARKEKHVRCAQARADLARTHLEAALTLLSRERNVAPNVILEPIL